MPSHLKHPNQLPWPLLDIHPNVAASTVSQHPDSSTSSADPRAPASLPTPLTYASVARATPSPVLPLAVNPW